MKIVNAKKIMGVAAAALLVGSLVSCGKSNLSTFDYGTDNINETTEVGKLAKATENGIEFAAGYTVTEKESGISFASSASFKNYPFVEAGKVYTFDMKNGATDVTTIKILAKGGIGALTVESKAAVGKSAATTLAAAGVNYKAGTYSIAFTQPKFDGAAASKVVGWRTKYSYAREDGLDVVNAIAKSTTNGSTTAAAATYWTEEDNGDNNFEKGIANDVRFASAGEKDLTAAATWSLTKNTDETDAAFASRVKAAAAPYQAYLLLEGYTWTVTTQTEVRVGTEQNYYVMNDKKVSDPVKAKGTKTQVNVKYNLNDTVAINLTNSAASSDKGYIITQGNYSNGKYTWKSDVQPAATVGYSAAARVAKDVKIVEGVPGVQVEETYSTGLNTTLKVINNYVSEKAVDAGSAWTTPDNKAVKVTYKYYKGYANDWYKTKKVTNGVTTYTYLDADGEFYSEHAWISNAGNNAALVKTVVVPTTALVKYADGYNYTVQRFADTSVTIYVKGTDPTNVDLDANIIQ